MDHLVFESDDLRPLLAAATSDGPPAVDLLAGVRRSQRRRRAIVPAASLATAGALGLTAFAVLTLGDSPSAQAKVAAAVARTSGRSFHVHIAQSGQGGHGGTAYYDGLFDPATRTGRMSYPGGAENRYLGDLQYTENIGPKAIPLPAGKHWIAYPRMTADLAKLPLVVSLPKLAPQDPQAELRQLRSATDVKDGGGASGPGWTGHRYTFSLRGDDRKGGLQATGSVDVDSSGLVRRLALALQPDQTHQQATKAGGDSNLVMDFGDYGTRVAVAAPPADQVITEDQLPGLDQPKTKTPKPSGSPSA